ncbi:MAG: 3-deoxy-D-manno-octulosonic acid transferase [bacterium]
MYILYNIAVIFLSILFSPLILAAFLIKPKFRAGFWNKLGFYANIKENKITKQSIWFHAVSVGEVNAVEALVKKAKIEFPEYNIAVTTVTKTGQQVAQNKLKNVADIISYFPYDNKFSVNAAINALNPKIVVIAETEIWPAFCHEVNKKNIPLLLVNGRISPNSYKGYKKIRFFFKKVLKNFSLILMQSDDDKNRIIDIGASSNNVEVMGNLKFDIANILTKDEIKELKYSIKSSDYNILIAGSTHKGEDETIINVYKRLKIEIKDLKLLIAPRHPERNDQVLKLICATGFKIGLRSKQSHFKNTDIILLDTMGELSKLYSVAKIAFIGGSFSGTGGHNPLEAAIYGIPVVSGADVFNFKDIFKFMADNKSATIVNNEDELSVNIRELFKNKEKYSAASEACLSIFEQNKGALDFAVEKFRSYL